jgi:F5/8 type C domain-containing protein
MTTGLVVQAPATTTTNFAPLRRDYASQTSGGAADTPGPNYGAFGCGPAQAVDDVKGTVWSTDAGSPQDLIVDLGRSIDLREIRIDPRAGCGDDPGSSLAQYELAASDGAGQPFERIAGGIVGAADARGYVVLPLAGDIAGRRLLRLRAIAPRDPNSPFMDVSELEVTGTPAAVSPPPISTPSPTPTPTPSPTPTPTPGPGPVAKVTSLSGARLTADRKGLFKVKVRFGDAAPVGRARITVSRKGKRLARASTPVRQGKTVTKTLRLSRKGRQVIRRGWTRRVKVQLRLPDGEKLTKTVKLTRKER